MLAAGVAQVDLARAEAHARTDLDQVVVAIEADLAMGKLDALPHHQAIVSPTKLDRDLLHLPLGADGELQAVARLDLETVLVGEIAQVEIKLLEHWGRLRIYPGSC
ncbi:hypothetical protein D3C84_999460 [compost metagenome]